MGTSGRHEIQGQGLNRMAGFLLRAGRMHPTAPLSVLQVAAPSTAGGLEAVVLALSAALTARGHRVALVAVLDARTSTHPVVNRAGHLGVAVIPLALPSRAYLGEYRALRRIIAAFRPDVVHTHGYRADAIGRMAARSEGVGHVTTAHGFTGGGWKNRFYEAVQLFTSRRADGVIAVSRSVHQRLLGAGVPPERLHLIQNAPNLDAPISREAARMALAIPPTDLAIGWVGRLSPEKGLDCFLRALAVLGGEGWTAHVVGAGPDRGAGERLAAELGLASRVRWHGEVVGAGRLLSAFDVLALTSRTEGTPIVLLEAARAGVPVVATMVGGVTDMYGPDEAELVPAGAPERVAEVLGRILAAPAEAQARAGRAAKAMQERFAPERWVAAHEELYRSIHAAKAGQRR